MVSIIKLFLFTTMFIVIITIVGNLKLVIKSASVIRTTSKFTMFKLKVVKH
jgi:hypothetical protein